MNLSLARIGMPRPGSRRLAASAICAVVLMLLASPSVSGMFEDLQELKKICEAKLLTKMECADRRAKILSRWDAEAPTWFCNYGGEATTPKVRSGDGSDTERIRYGESASASLVVKEILDEAGLAPNFIVRAGGVPNAAASLRGDNRYIEYNPRFVSQLKQGARTNWAVYSVLAHEIGHHLQGHTLTAGGSRPETELEADEYSGHILAKLGANLEEAQIAMRTFGSDAGSATHPPKANRLRAIEKGWSRAGGESKGRRADEPALRIPPLQMDAQFTDRCIVEGREIFIDGKGGIHPEGLIDTAGHPRCAFDLVAPYGRYCVNRDDGEVLLVDDLGWYSVGFCEHCAGLVDCP